MLHFCCRLNPAAATTCVPAHLVPCAVYARAAQLRVNAPVVECLSSQHVEHGLSNSRRAVQGQDQRALRLGLCQVVTNGIADLAESQLLPHDLGVEVRFQPLAGARCKVDIACRVGGQSGKVCGWVGGWWVGSGGGASGGGGGFCSLEAAH